MQLILDNHDLRILQEKDELTKIITTCTEHTCTCADKPEAPKAKKTTKKTTKKTEPKEEPKEESKEEPKEAPKEEFKGLTKEDLAEAAMPLVRAGKSEELSALLATYGVDSIPSLTDEQISAFAEELQKMGAEI